MAFLRTVIRTAGQPTFDFPDALVNVPGGTELTFVFEIGGASVEKKTTLIEE